MKNVDILRAELLARTVLDLKLSNALCEYHSTCLEGGINKDSRDKGHVLLDAIFDSLGVQAHCTMAILNGDM